MAETGWTDEFPQIDGAFYWRRLKADHANLDIGELIDDTLCCTGESTHTRSYIRKDFEYLGPVTAADFEQLTRLRESAEKALRLIGKGRGHIGWCRHRHQQINDRDSNASLDEWLKDRTQVEDALREALAQRNTGGK